MFPIWVVHELNVWRKLRGIRQKIIRDNGVEELSEKEMLRRIMVSLEVTKRVKEAMVPGSPVIGLDEWPQQVCALRNKAGQHIGFGSFIVVNGKWVCLTAGHVLQECLGGIMWTPKSTVMISSTSRVIIRGSLDVVGFEVSNVVAAALGCKKMKLARTPAMGSVISLHGYVNGKMSLTKGNVSGLGGVFKFKHTASTLPGFCGSPVIVGENKIVGIHIESDGMGFNYGLSLDLFVRNKEADTYAEDKWLFGQFEELETDEEDDSYWYGYDEEEGIVQMGNKKYRVYDDENPFVEGIKDYLHERNERAQGLATWAWEKEEDEMNEIRKFLRTKESGKASDFPGGSGDAPQTSSQTTLGSGTTGSKKKNKKKTKKPKTSSSSSANSEVQTVATEETQEDPKPKSTVSTPPSKDGDGLNSTQRQRESASGSTQGTSEKDKDQQSKSGTSSSKRSWKLKSTQELGVLLASQIAKKGKSDFIDQILEELEKRSKDRS